MSSRSFFGLQVAVQVPVDHPVRTTLLEAVEALRGVSKVSDQRVILRRLAGTFRLLGPWLWRGDWDLLHEDADRQWGEWTAGVEAMANWPVADFGSGGDYLLLTLCAVVTADSNAARMLGDACDVPEKEWFTKRTFGRLLATPPLMNPVGLRRLAFYVAPHPHRSGFSSAVLSGEGFEYLMPLS